MRTRTRDSVALGAGSAISGLLAYLFFAMVTRTLGAEAAAPVTVLWTYWGFAAAALTFPLQHWVVRTITAHGGEEQVRSALPRVAVVVVFVAAIAGFLSWLLRDALFHREDLWFPLLVVGVTLGSAWVGVLRGVLAARERFLAVAWALVAENLVRCLVSAVLMGAGETASHAYGVVLLSGQVVGLMWPSSFRLEPASSRPTSREPWAGFVGGAGGGQLIAQTVLISGPVVVALSGGSPTGVTALFAGLALFRAPYTLALGVVSQATGRLTSAVVAGRTGWLRKVRLGIAWLTLLGAGISAAVGALAGPGLVRAIFGPEVDLRPALALLIAVGSALALGNLALSVLMMAHNRAGAAFRAWLPAAAVAAVVLAFAGGSATDAVSTAFVVAETTAFVILFAQGSPARASGPLGKTHVGLVERESRLL